MSDDARSDWPRVGDLMIAAALMAEADFLIEWNRNQITGHVRALPPDTARLKAVLQAGLRLSEELVVPEPHWDGYYEGDYGAQIPFYRCASDLICWDCWRPYAQHPDDMREACLTVLCNGWRVKL